MLDAAGRIWRAGLSCVGVIMYFIAEMLNDQTSAYHSWFILYWCLGIIMYLIAEMLNDQTSAYHSWFNLYW